MESFINIYFGASDHHHVSPCCAQSVSDCDVKTITVLVFLLVSSGHVEPALVMPGS